MGPFRIGGALVLSNACGDELSTVSPYQSFMWLRAMVNLLGTTPTCVLFFRRIRIIITKMRHVILLAVWSISASQHNALKVFFQATCRLPKWLINLVRILRATRSSWPWNLPGLCFLFGAYVLLGSQVRRVKSSALIV